MNENAKPERGMNRIQSGSRGRNANMHQKENNHCVLSRSIGTSDARLILVLTQKNREKRIWIMLFRFSHIVLDKISVLKQTSVK